MRKYIHNITALACAAVALAGCAKFEWTSGTPVRFGARTQAEALTKTSYGEILTTTPRVQMINWTDGDRIRIVCAQASTAGGDPTSADYVTTGGVKTVNSETSRTESWANISLAGNNDKGLRWGSTSDTHIFYGVYPSPSVRPAGYSDNLTVEGTLTGTIPDVQTPVSVSTSAPYVATPDMKNQYLVAKRTVAAGNQDVFDSNDIILYFTPITTAIEFEVTNAMTEDLDIDSIELLSTSYYLSGDFTAGLTGLAETGGTYPTVTSSTTYRKQTAKVSFGTSGLTLAPNNKLTFTIFLLPESDLNDLTFRINKKGTGAGYIQTALKTDASTWIKFDVCKKHFVKGLFAQDGAKWTLCFNPYVDPWSDATGTSKDLEDSNLGSLPSLIKWEAGENSGLDLEEKGFVFALTNGSSDASQTFSGDIGDMTSTSRVKTIPITSTQSDENQSWSIKSVNGTAVTGNSYSITDQLEVTKDTDGNLVIKDKRPKISYGDNDHWTTYDGKASNMSTWAADWTLSTSTSPVDLSKYDFKSDGKTAHSMTTANCYVIHHAGTYKIPLVYGNGVVGGYTNSASYAPTIASGGSNYLTPFVNHLGYGIRDPFIENNTDDGYEKCNITSGPPSSRRSNNFIIADHAEVVWSEVSDLITVTRDIKGTKKTQGDNTYNDGNYTSGNVRWIEFTVSNSNIRQCNAVIAVKDANNKIMWSWHIWITNNPDLSKPAIPVTNYAGTTSSFMAASALGWIDPDLYEKKDDVTIVLEQEESDEQLTVTVKQSEYKFEAKNPYYQFGRKDPMRYGITSDVNTGTTDIKTSILNPGAFYTAWTSGGYYNLWTGKESKIYTLAALTGNNSDAEEGTNLIKTIYDPSPAGYKVPSTKAFTGFTTTGTKSSSVSDINAEGSYHKGWDFYTNSSKSSTIFFPVVYIRKSDGSKSTSAMGRYSTSTPNNDSGNSFFEFQFQSTYVYPMTEKSSRANALSVRPIEE